MKMTESMETKNVLDLGKLVFTTKDEIYLKKYKKSKKIYYAFLAACCCVLCLWVNLVLGMILAILCLTSEAKKENKSKVISYCEVYERGIKGISKGDSTYNHSFTLLYEDINYLSVANDEFTIFTRYLSYDVWACKNITEVVSYINTHLKENP